MQNILAIYPGSFDPVSNGHLDIIERASKIFAHLIVLVSLNPHKKYLFNVEERESMLKEATKHLKNVEVVSSNLLVIDFAKAKGAKVIVRGIRNQEDFMNEQNLFAFNHTLDSNIETIALFPSANTLFISSSGIKELALFHDDIKDFVPSSLSDYIVKTIRERFNK